MAEGVAQSSANGSLATDPRWARLVAQWFEEQAALVVAELERAGTPEPESPDATGAGR